MAAGGLADLPDLSRDALVEFGGWTVLREARALVKAGAVKRAEWSAPEIRGEVVDGGHTRGVTVNLRSVTFATNRCGCADGRRGRFCRHAIAVCLALEARRKAEVAAAARKPATTPPRHPKIEEQPAPPAAVGWLREADDGAALAPRFILPPNLPAAAKRNAIPVRLELAAAGERPAPPERLFRGRAYCLSPGARRALARLTEWSGGERPHGFMQLKAGQLGSLVADLAGSDAFYWANAAGKPLAWDGKSLVGVSEHLPKPDAPKAAAAVTVKRGRPGPPPRPSAVEAFRAAPAGTPPGRNGGGLEIDGSPHFLSVHLPDKDDPLYERLSALLREHDFRLEHSNGRWWLRDRHKVLSFLARHEHNLAQTYRAEFTGNFQARFAAREWVRWKVRGESSGDHFAVSVEAGSGAPDTETIRRAIASGQPYILAPDKVFLIDLASLERAEKVQQALSGNPSRPFSPEFRQTLKTPALAPAESALEDVFDDEEIVLPEEWKARTAALRSIQHLATPPLPDDLAKCLRGYQMIGVAWMWHLARNGLGGVLADEMGLGKTPQALALLAAARSDAGRRQPSLVVCPASLLENWRREAARFTPAFSVFIHHGNNRLESPEDAARYDIVLTSYGTLTRDEALFNATPFRLAVADEAQHIKNRRTQAAKALRRVRADARFVLTGTPVENSVDDLRSLFAFVLPGHLRPLPPGLRGDDKRWHDNEDMRRAAPYILRRSKQLVAPELPEKLEQTVFCEMSAAQARLYAAVRTRTEQTIAELESTGASEGRIRIAALAQLLRLRQVCAEPRLLEDSLRPRDSGKLLAFRELLEEAVDGGHRMLVFSQFVSVLTHLRAFLQESGYTYNYLDGSTRDRQGEVDRFNIDPSVPVFLISLKAGGSGLNLTGADTVVHFDPWWNPAVEAQATDRAHRIGQTRTVTSYKLIMASTVEERVLELQRTKAGILRDLLDESAAQSATVSLKDIKNLVAAM
ncbi:MAG: DEAD/DEAH box helicase [Opitutales bacterium]|nr:DEAD/DEAH box helicase [Opitutales bacterium]